MCSGKDSGNLDMQKTLCCDSLYRLNISTLEFHCQLILEFGDGVLRLHHLGRGCREFNSGLASIMKTTPFILADQEHVNTVQVVGLVLKNHQDNSRFIHCTGVICENCSQHCPCTTGIQQCVCTRLVPRKVMEVHKNWYLQVLFHFFSHLKKEQMGSLDPW